MSAPVVWVTRTAEGAARTAAALEDKGCEAVVAPVLAVLALPFDVGALRFDAAIFTGSNGLKAFCAGCPRRDVTAWCVGDATAEAARAQGFAAVISAGGDVKALFETVKRDAPRSAQFLYAAPREPAAPLEAWLWAEGFKITKVTVYDTQPVAPLIDAATLDRLTHVMIHSPRAAHAVAHYLFGHHSEIAFEKLSFICISEAAGRALTEDPQSQGKKLSLRISAFPDDASMLMLIATD